MAMVIPFLNLVKKAKEKFEARKRSPTIAPLPSVEDKPEADKLAKAASRKEQLPSDVFFEEITQPSVKPKKEKQVSNISSEDWRKPIMEYLRGNIELPNEKEEKKMFQRARGYVISEGELFKSGVTSPWLKCISTTEGIELLKKILPGFADPTLASDNLSPKPSGKDSSGQRR